MQARVAGITLLEEHCVMVQLCSSHTECLPFHPRCLQNGKMGCHLLRSQHRCKTCQLKHTDIRPVQPRPLHTMPFISTERQSKSTTLPHIPTLCLSCATAAAMAAGLAVMSCVTCIPNCSLNCFNMSTACSLPPDAWLLLISTPKAACNAARSGSNAPYVVAPATPLVLPGRLLAPAADNGARCALAPWSVVLLGLLLLLGVVAVVEAARRVANSWLPSPAGQQPQIQHQQSLWDAKEHPAPTMPEIQKDAACCVCCGWC